MSKWDITKIFLNNNLGKVVTRKDIIEFVEPLLNHRLLVMCRNKRFIKTSSIDTYRNYLYKAGYLEYIKRPNGKKWLGRYRVIKTIPTDLSVDDVRIEAYKIPMNRKLFTPILNREMYIGDEKQKEEFITKEEMKL